MGRQCCITTVNSSPGNRTLGVIGGLGPAATLDFHAKLLQFSEAVTDQEHIRILIDSNPAVPDRNAALAGTGESPGPHLAKMAAGLEQAGAGLIVMACNAAHAWQAEIEAAMSVPFLSMIDAVVAETMQHRPRRVGLLAANATLDAQLYQTAFAGHGVEVIHPDREEFMALLYRIKSGDTGDEVRSRMRQLAVSLEGIDVLVAGCTEVPLVLTSFETPVIDSAAALARAALAELNQPAA